jgi:hypothetical protein
VPRNLSFLGFKSQRDSSLRSVHRERNDNQTDFFRDLARQASISAFSVKVEPALDGNWVIGDSAQQLAPKSPHPIGGLLASATPDCVARIVPLGSVKKDRCPVVPGVTGVAVIV